MPDETSQQPVAVRTAPSRSKVVHHTPLKPGSDWHPQNGAVSPDLAKRIAEVKIVAQRAPTKRMHVVAAKLVSGEYQVLYLGSDPAAADKIAKAFDPAVHDEIYMYCERAMPRRYSAPRPKSIHNTPLQGGESIAQMNARLVKAASEANASTELEENEITTPINNGVDSGAPASTNSAPASAESTEKQPEDNPPAKPAPSLANPKKK
jgi:hypothetical protein